MPLCRPEDTQEQCARRWRQALQRREKEARDLLLQRYGEAYRWMRDELTALLKDIAAEQGEVSPGKLWQARRYRILLAQIEAELDRLGAVATRETEKAQYDALQMAWEGAGEQLQAAGLEVSFAAFPKEVFQELVGALAYGTPLAAHFLQTVTPEALDALRQALTAGLAAGWHPSRVARWAAQKATGPSLARAMTIARTEMLRAYREGTRRRYAEAGVGEWQWLSARDRRTCPACLALHGKKFSADEPQRGHPNCRCTMVPVIPGVDYGTESGEAWLRKQPLEVQEAILGKMGAALYRARVVQLKDFAHFRDDAFGGMWTSRSLKNILGEEGKRHWAQRYRWLQRLRGLSGGERLFVEFAPGEVLERVGVSWTREVILTAGRRGHYLARHPEVADYEIWLPDTIAAPDVVLQDRKRQERAHFFREVAPGLYLRAVVHLRSPNEGGKVHAIVTVWLQSAYNLQRELKRGLRIWPQ